MEVLTYFNKHSFIFVKEKETQLCVIERNLCPVLQDQVSRFAHFLSVRHTLWSHTKEEFYLQKSPPSRPQKKLDHPLIKNLLSSFFVDRQKKKLEPPTKWFMDPLHDFFVFVFWDPTPQICLFSLEFFWAQQKKIYSAKKRDEKIKENIYIYTYKFFFGPAIYFFWNPLQK